MNKKDLIISLTKVLSTQKEARDAVERTFSAMKHSLGNGDKVVISGFGSFYPYIAKAKNARNPKTGQTVQVSAKRKLRFHQAKDFFK
jgi:nucleoid DNA-binding protein